MLHFRELLDRKQFTVSELYISTENKRTGKIFTFLCLSSSIWHKINKKTLGKIKGHKNEQQQKYLVKYQSVVMNCGSTIIDWNSKLHLKYLCSHWIWWKTLLDYIVSSKQMYLCKIFYIFLISTISTLI